MRLNTKGNFLILTLLLLQNIQNFQIIKTHLPRTEKKSILYLKI
jgi:hypothetical protein